MKEQSNKKKERRTSWKSPQIKTMHIYMNEVGTSKYLI